MLNDAVNHYGVKFINIAPEAEAPISSFVHQEHRKYGRPLPGWSALVHSIRQGLPSQNDRRCPSFDFRLSAFRAVFTLLF